MKRHDPELIPAGDRQARPWHLPRQPGITTLRFWLLVAVAAVLAACGGAEGPAADGGRPEAVVSALRLQFRALSAQAATPSEAANQLMDHAEAVYPTYFPSARSTAESSPFLYRYYPETGTYVGVVVSAGSQFELNGVYVMGGSFGNSPLYAGPLTRFITPVPGSGGRFATGAEPGPLDNLLPVMGPSGTPNLLSKTALAVDAALPSRMNLSSQLGPARWQGYCGTCVAFASVAALEAEVFNVAGLKVDLAEQQVTSCSGLYSTCGIGTYVSSVTGFLQSQGLVEEQAYPYTSGASRVIGGCAIPLGSLPQRAVKAQAWRNYAIASSNDLKNVLFRLQRPVIASMTVYMDFHTYLGGIYRPIPGSAVDGGHAVIVVGYSDDDQVFIARNSWGSGWGEQGYFRIPYSEVSAASMTNFAVRNGGVTGVEGVSSSVLPTYAGCTASTNSTAYCNVSVQAGNYVDYVVTGAAEARGHGTNSGSMSLNMAANGVACNPSYGAISPVDNQTVLSGAGYRCSGRVFGGEQVRVSLNAPNDRADAVYTIGSVSIVEKPIATLTTSAACTSTSNSTAYCDLTASPAKQSATFTVAGRARAVGDGTNSGTMQLVMSIDGRPCNANAGTVYGVDNATQLEGAGFTCQTVVAGGRTVRVSISASNSRADAVFTTGSATFVESPQ